MNLPAKINILGQEFQIVMVRGYKKKGFLGKCLIDSNVIKLDADIPKDKLYCVLLHEILHGIDLFLGLKLKHQKQLDLIALALYEVLRDNALSFGGEEGTAPTVNPTRKQRRKKCGNLFQ